jgi:threo-3-hydroxy-L-aspartate ammonia-lyase
MSHRSADADSARADSARAESAEDAGPDTPLTLVTIADVIAAAGLLGRAVVRTPLLPFGELVDGDPLGRTRAYLKAESLQATGAFKLRGAYHAIATLSPEPRAIGVVAHSSGNFAQGVARAARLLGVRAVIVMPSDASPVKLDRTRADGAEVVLVGPASDEREAKATELARDHGFTLLHPHDDNAVIAGYGTVGLEIVEQLAELMGGAPGRIRTGDDDFRDGARDPVTILVPIGGGGLSSGVAVSVKSLLPGAVVLGVEPELAADARESLAQGRIVRWPAERVGATIADGQRLQSIGTLTFSHLSRFLDGVVAVGEDEIRRAMVRAQREARLVLEPSGATTLAALLFHRSELPLGRVVCVLSGGNVDPARYDALIAEGVAAGG